LKPFHFGDWGLGIKERGNALPLLYFCSIFNRFDEMFNPKKKNLHYIMHFSQYYSPRDKFKLLMGVELLFSNWMKIYLTSNFDTS